MARRKRGQLSDEDRSLWDRVAATAKPLTPPKAAGPASTSETKRTAKKPVNPVPRFEIGQTAPRSTKTQTVMAPSVSNRLAAAPVRMDHGTHKKMVRGKLKPEGRLDLHGMTLADAHPALISFLFAAHERDARLVLVITGKGKDRDSGGPIPIRRGILRHQVPTWLTAPPLGAIVLDVREAHHRHGGGGALYVYLKRRR